MAPIPPQFLATRDLSSDNTITIIFGMIGCMLATLSVGIGWMMWKRTPGMHFMQQSLNEGKFPKAIELTIPEPGLLFRQLLIPSFRDREKLPPARTYPRAKRQPWEFPRGSRSRSVRMPLGDDIQEERLELE